MFLVVIVFTDVYLQRDLFRSECCNDKGKALINDIMLFAMINKEWTRITFH